MNSIPRPLLITQYSLIIYHDEMYLTYHVYMLPVPRMSNDDPSSKKTLDDSVEKGIKE